MKQLRKTINAIATPLLLAALAAGHSPPPATADGIASASPPALLQPGEGTVLDSFGQLLRWDNPPGSTQVEVQVLPAGDDGPGVDLILNATDGRLDIPPPPRWYGLLPDMGYTWRVRGATADVSLTPDDSRWGVWAERHFRTPKVSAQSISLASPEAATAPILRWRDSRPDVFYYEVQLSSDATFNQDPATATTSVYSSIIHGGVTDPPDSYQAPSLQPGTRYYWRVRPRVQGDGTPVDWAAAAVFTTPAPAVPALPTLDTPEVQALGLINDIRESRGLLRLGFAQQLAAAARAHSADMASTGVMTHTGSDGSTADQRITQAGYTWRVYGEIVAAGQATAPRVVDQWMNSPTHKAVILEPSLREFGAGLVKSSSGRPYWTVDFGTR